MQPLSSSAPGQTASQNPSLPNGPNPPDPSYNPVPPTNGAPAFPSPAIPAFANAATVSATGSVVNGIGPRNSPPPTFPVPVTPLRHGTVPSPPRTPLMHPLRPIQSAPYSFPIPSIPQVNPPVAPPAATPTAAPTTALTAAPTAPPATAPATAPTRAPTRVPTGPNAPKKTEYEFMVEKVKELFENLTYPAGEIPIFDKHDVSWTLIRSGEVATQKRDSGPWWNLFGSGISWTDTYGILLDNQFLLLEEETSPTGVTKSSLVIKPILLEYLSLASFDDEPEVRKYPIGLFKRIGSRFRKTGPPTHPKKEPNYPFTIYHVAAKITRRYTIYTKKGTERNKWKVALQSAIETRKSHQDPRMLYEPQVLNDGFFKIAPRIQFNRGTYYTGRVVSAALFAFQGEGYIAIGCATGIYVSKRAVEYSFVKVLEFNEPNSIVAIPEFNKFLVHCESELSSYPLDKVVHVSQGTAEYKNLGDSAEQPGPAEGDGDVLFLKAGSIVDRTGDQPVNRTVVIYAAKSPEKVLSHVKELVGYDASTNPQTSAVFKPLGQPMTIPDDPHDATCFHDKVAICASKAIYFVEPTNREKTSPDVVPEEKDKKAKKIKKKDLPKVDELVDKASILGMATYEMDLLHKEIILVYNDLGCFVDEGGKRARSDYYIEWERKATAFARRGPHLLLFSPGYIEVRNVGSGKLELVKMVGVNELRPLRSGLTEGRLLVGVMTGGSEDDGSRTEKLVELIYHGVDT